MAVYAPIAGILQQEFGVDYATIGLLSGVPVFCFAAFSPVASFIIAKRGLDFTFTTSLIIVCAGILLRFQGSFLLVLISTIIIGAGVAFMNIAIPLIIARDFKERFTQVIGIYSLTSNTGNIFAASLTVPLSYLLGWNLAILCWIFLSLTNLAVWVAYILRKRRGKSRHALVIEGVDWKAEKQLRKLAKRASKLDAQSYINPISRSSQDASCAKKSRPLYKMGFTYGVCFVFICQCFGFFSLTAWLPSIFNNFGMDTSQAGVASSIFPAVGIIGSLAAATLVKHFRHWGAFLAVGICWCALPFGLSFAPTFWYIWIVLAGFAQAANYVIVFSVITAFAKNSTEVRKLSSVTQMSAYFVAGVSPTIIGWVHDFSSGWSVPLAIWCGAMLSMCVVGVLTYRKVKDE